MDRTAKQDRTATALLEAAATVFSEQGEAARMTDVADGAGVGAATLYRYFPNKELLLAALVTYASEETVDRLTSADLDAVPFFEGVARVARALVASRSKYAVLAKLVGRVDREKVEFRFAQPIRALLRRGLDDGSLRADLTEDELLVALGSLIQAASYLSLKGEGIERAANIASSVFLNGTAHNSATRTSTTAQDHR